MRGMGRTLGFLLVAAVGLSCSSRGPVGPRGQGGSGSGGAGGSLGGGGSGGAGAGGSTDAGRDTGGPDLRPPVDAGPPNACATASDCTFGEIDHEILSRADCICLFGCPFIAESKTTAARRMAQYQALCTPGRDATGNPCPIDDCALPPTLMCVNGGCVAPRN